MNSDINTRWMQWNEIQIYQDQLIALERELIQKYHYPDIDIPLDYCVNSVSNLETHLQNGNTFFFGITKKDELLGYYWAYTVSFINKKRWVLRSFMIRDDYQQTGLGAIAMKAGIEKAYENTCDEMSTEYVPWNHDAAKLYQKYGFEIRRVEVVKTLSMVGENE